MSLLGGCGEDGRGTVVALVRRRLQPGTVARVGARRRPRRARAPRRQHRHVGRLLLGAAPAGQEHVRARLARARRRRRRRTRGRSRVGHTHCGAAGLDVGGISGDPSGRLLGPPAQARREGQLLPVIDCVPGSVCGDRRSACRSSWRSRRPPALACQQRVRAGLLLRPLPRRLSTMAGRALWRSHRAQRGLGYRGLGQHGLRLVGDRVPVRAQRHGRTAPGAGAPVAEPERLPRSRPVLLVGVARLLLEREGGAA